MQPGFPYTWAGEGSRHLQAGTLLKADILHNLCCYFLLKIFMSVLHSFLTSKHPRAFFSLSCERVTWGGGGAGFPVGVSKVCSLPVLGDFLQPTASYSCMFLFKGAGTRARALLFHLTL